MRTPAFAHAAGGGMRSRNCFQTEGVWAEAWEPALPLILAAWHDIPYLMKTLQVAEHIEWVNEHGELESVVAFLRALRALREEDRVHLGELIAMLAQMFLGYVA